VKLSTHGGVANNLRVNIKWIESEDLMDDSNFEARLRDFDAILVPGGFGKRGVEGHDSRDFLRAQNAHALLWDLPRHADRLH
jgi:CTP synthase (UTP-ammonia lyase)